MARSQSRAATTSTHYTPIQELGLADPEVGWAVNGAGVYVTTDGGRNWRTVTPPLIKLGDPTEDVDSIVGVGSQDLWMPVNDVFGVVPPGTGDGSVRAEGIEAPTNGGQTWTFTTLVSGCLQSCGPDSVSFVDAKDGFAAGEIAINGPTTMLYSTVDGGVTWQPVALIPGGGAHDVTFTTTTDGWAVTGPTTGTYAQNGGRVTDPGGTLYRTTDGGVTWAMAPGLPSTSRYQLPTFFNQNHGVVLGQAQGHGVHIPVVYVTDDGGATWDTQPLPANRAIVATRCSIPLLTASSGLPPSVRQPGSSTSVRICTPRSTAGTAGSARSLHHDSQPDRFLSSPSPRLVTG